LFFCAISMVYAQAQTTSDDFDAEAPVVAGLLDAGRRAESHGAYRAAELRYCAAALLGSAEAQYRLGSLYLAGRGATADAATARTLLAMAAQRGHQAAGRALGNRPAGAEQLPGCLTAGWDVLALAGVEPDEAGAVEGELPVRSVERMRVVRIVQRLAPRFAVDPRLALAIARVESNFDSSAISPRNAMGVMQLIPATAARFAVDDPLDAEQNVRGGLAYLRWLLDAFDGDIASVAAAYNAGEGRVWKYGGVPPYAETQAYVRKVLQLYGSSQHVLQPAGLKTASAI
jgi:soluble lytic murein transglycosylase-like protein